MANSVKVTVSGDRAIVAEFDAAADDTLPKVRKVVEKGAVNVKTDTRRRWSNISHAPHLPYSVTYDVDDTDDGVKAEIGPEEGAEGQGWLGGIIELGGLKNAPIPGLIPSLEVEQPKFVKALEDVLKDILP